MRCTHCGECCTETEMELSDDDIGRLVALGYHRDAFSVTDQDGVQNRFDHDDDNDYLSDMFERKYCLCPQYKDDSLATGILDDQNRTIQEIHDLTSEDSKLDSRDNDGIPNREDYDRLQKWQALGRFGTPEEMANVALFLASDESSYVASVGIKADGGCTQGYRFNAPS